MKTRTLHRIIGGNESQSAWDRIIKGDGLLRKVRIRLPTRRWNVDEAINELRRRRKRERQNRRKGRL
ncbi:MAG TPA: hypothetical protein VNA25_12640 [Phycisphaerae bacterium]|nr:hypothetical protein [Phycisphaerae bacterium]